MGQVKPARDPASRLVLSWYIPPAGTSKICGGDVGEATAVDISTCRGHLLLSLGYAPMRMW